MNATEAIQSLTPAGREFMALVGASRFDFFDEGIIGGSGNWGNNMSWQAANMMGRTGRSIAGIMSRLASPALGLWTTSCDYPDDGQWWELTELGAAVARAAAGVVAA